MSSIAFQITCVSIIYFTVCSGTDQRKHQSSESLVTGELSAQRASNAENASIWWRHHIVEMGFLIRYILLMINLCLTSPKLNSVVKCRVLPTSFQNWHKVHNTAKLIFVEKVSFICRVNILVRDDHDDVIKWKHFPRYWPFVRGIHRWPVKSPHKGQWRGAFWCVFWYALE